MKRVEFPQEQYALLAAHLQDAYPNEGAGFLFGRITDEAFIVESVMTLPNTWDEGSQRNRFRLSAEDSLKAELEAGRRGSDVIGVFHSHPDHPAVPSQWDLEWAAWPNFAYLITTVAQGKAERTRAWQLRADRSAFEEDDLRIT
ncbi:MAG: M67 family metallopeptidase [Chloroflexi bacterium]|nr:M67 family metallopeptidase [Chloroflexota bacterium]